MTHKSNLLFLSVLLLSTSQISNADSFTYTTFTVLDGSTSAAGINDFGQVTGYTQLNSASYGFVYQDGTAITFAPSQPGQVSTLPSGINNLGVVAGTNVTAMGPSGFLYQGGAFTDLSYPGFSNTFISGINDLGQVIGVYFDPANNFRTRGFYSDTAGIYHPVTGAFADTFAPTSIDNSGRIGGLLYGFGTSASAIYADGQYTTLPAGYQLQALNNLGQIAVYIQPALSGGLAVPGAFALIDTDGTVTRFSFPSDWVYARIGGLNDLGQLAGFAEYKVGSDVFSFIATPIAKDVARAETPEPGSLLLCSITFALLPCLSRAHCTQSARK